jgi:hypothetical protein
MADLTLSIGRLALSFEGAEQHTHRVRPIGRRALVLLQEYVEQRMVESGLAGDMDVEQLSVPPLELNLSLTGDEEIAHRLAEAMYGALAMQLRGLT